MNVSPASATATSIRTPRVLLVGTSYDHVADTTQPAGMWLSELTDPYQVLAARGAKVDVATIGGGMPPFEPRSVATPEQRAILDDPVIGTALRTAPALRDVDTSGYDAIILAGGHGAMFDYPDNPAVQQAVAGVYERGGIAASVCHGVSGLANVMVDGAPLVAGQRVTGYTNAEDGLYQRNPELRPILSQQRLTARGAEFVVREPGADHIEISGDNGRLISGQNPNSARSVGTAVADRLGLA